MRLILVLLLPIIGGCASHAPAPVEDRGVAAAIVAPTLPAAQAMVPATDIAITYHTVKKGDTLYSISLDHGRDYKDVASWNSLDNPNLIKIGQQLRVTPLDTGAPVAVVKPVNFNAPVETTPNNPSTAPSAAAQAAPAAAPPVATSPASANTETFKREPKGGKLAYSEEALAKARHGDLAERPAEAKSEPKPAETKPPEKTVALVDDLGWMWPASGKLIAPFAEGVSKGVDIAGKAGDPVLAAAGGVVSYAGTGLRGYGNLVVLRHNASYLSVYAHNSKMLVKEKQTVTRGQKIAEIGSTDAESPRLHFEIRHEGKPTDPQKFLPPR